MSDLTKLRAALLCATAAMAVTGAHGAAFAQTQPESETSDTIVVTAERRSMDVQQTPIAVTVLGAEDLEDKGVEQMSDLQFATPSLTVNNAALTSGVNIRGIGLNSGSPRSAPGVATYRDGVLVPAILNQTGFFDIGSVEVLRGPQGTFAGSYSTGGALYINSRDPDLNGINGYLTGGFGDYGEHTVGGAFNVPLSDTFAARVAIEGQQRDSYYDFINGGQGDPQPGGLEEFSGRLGLLWSPTSQFRSVLKIEGVDREAGGRDYRPPETSVYHEFAAADPRTLDFDTLQSVHEQAVRLSWRSDYEFGNGITLRSTTGANYSFAENVDDLDASAGINPIASPTALGSEQHQVVYERTASQEVDLISPDDGRFSWVLGAYVYQTSIYVDIDGFTSPTAGRDHTLNVNIHTRKGNHGVFAHGRYDLTDSLEAEVGVRYSHSFTADDGTVTIVGGAGPFDLVVPNDGSHSDDGVTGKVGLNWTVDEDNFLFAFVARGFKPGTANGSSGVLAPFVSPGLPGADIAPEFVTDYETGWRSTMFDGALRLQTGVFYSDYQDFQIDTIDTATGLGGMVNAEGATLYGAEFQAQLSAGDFHADFGLAYLQTEVEDADVVNTAAGFGPPPGPPTPQCNPPGVDNTVGPGCFNYTTIPVAGNQMQNAPELTYTVGAEYDFHLGDTATLTPRINYSYIGEQWAGIQNQPEERLESRSLVSASLIYSDGDWRVRGYVNNATDELYTSGLFGNLGQFYGPPRTYGIELTKNF